MVISQKKQSSSLSASPKPTYSATTRCHSELPWVGLVAGVIGALVSLLLFELFLPLPQPDRLVGFACEGSVDGEPLYAAEEDLFPAECERIERVEQGVP